MTSGSIRIVQIEERFAEALERLQRECFPTLADHELMTRDNFLSHCRIFPEGDFVALDTSGRHTAGRESAGYETGHEAPGRESAGHESAAPETTASNISSDTSSSETVVGGEERVVGLGSGFFTDFDFDHPDHTFQEMIAGGDYSNHDPNGEWYYGGDISVHPDYRGYGIGRMLYEARKDLVRRYRRRGIVAGGALPGYAAHAGTLTVPEYVDKVVKGELSDPTLSFQLKNGFEVRGLLQGYIEDSATGNWASLIVWENDG